MDFKFYIVLNLNYLNRVKYWFCCRNGREIGLEYSLYILYICNSVYKIWLFGNKVIEIFVVMEILWVW